LVDAAEEWLQNTLDAVRDSIRVRVSTLLPGLLPHLLLLRSQMSLPKLSARVKDILVCPVCRGALSEKGDALDCQGCSRSFALNNAVPVFLSEPLQLVAPNHSSNPIGPEYEAVLRGGHDFVLNIGAGGTAQRYPNCVEFEHKIFRHTDVVGDAHHLPFREATFDRVFAFNVFEHLADPTTAAQEIHRVLKPGGGVVIHTAFLQALHEEPHHFYNATEYGVRQWFAPFEIEDCRVSGNFSPGGMLAFLMSQVLESARLGGVPLEEQGLISGSKIGEWAEFYDKHGAPPPGFNALQSLPQPIQKRIAAGFELLARKPLKP
jgi:SAM-dependent methyltransferase